MSLYGVIALLQKNKTALIGFENKILKFELKIKANESKNASKQKGSEKQETFILLIHDLK